MPHLSVFKTIPCSRNYWWSSSAPLVSSTSPPPPVPTNELPLPRAESIPTVGDELPVANATLHESSPVASKEPVAHSDGVTEQVESSASSVTSDIPIDVSISDFPPPPLEFGDFSALGLTGWGLGGIAVVPFEWIQVLTGLPWFYTIIAGTLFWRLVMVPLALADIQDSAKMRSSEISKTYKAFIAAKESRDPVVVRAAALRCQQARAKAGVKFRYQAARTAIQLPVAIGLFLAVKNMCELPLEQLKYSGVSFLPDLTLAPGTAACDPYSIIPILSVVALNVQLNVCHFNHILCFQY
jgi:YidC/Oxa1 family membrane protein insertase